MHKLKFRLCKKVQGKLSSFLFKTNKKLSKPEKRCYKELITSILITGHVHLRKLAAKIQDNMSLKNICKRFERHLAKIDFRNIIDMNCLIKQCGKIKYDTIICVDSSDIVKKEAKKMEGIKQVRDGSKNCQSPGYDVLDIVAFDRSKQRIIPLSSDLFSTLMDFDSMKDKVYDRINDIQYFTNNKGIYTFDRGYDDRKFIHYLIKNAVRFVMRSMLSRSFYVQLEGDEEIKSYKFEDILHRVTMQQLSEKSRFKGCVIDCFISVDPHPRKHPNLIPVKLVISRYIEPKNANSEEGGYFAFICNLEDDILSEEEFVSKVMRIYRLRWKIEEVHRHVKQAYRWEDLCLKSYERLVTMNKVLWAAICFLYSLDSLIEEIKLIFQHKFSDRSYRKRKGFYFIYYRLSDIIKELFDVVERRWIHKYRGRHYNRMQMIIKFE